MLKKVSACAVIILASVFTFAAGQNSYLMKGDQARLAPRLLNYQGFLTDTLGNPITNPSVSMTFAIFDAVSVGNQKWTETQSTVSVDKGIFHVLLGSVTPIPDSVFTSSASRWLQLTISGQALSPRTRIVAMPYAYSATYSDTAQYAKSAFADTDWVISGTNMYSGVSGNVGIGTSNPLVKLDVNGVICGGTADTVKALYGGVLSGYSNLAGDQYGDTTATVAGGWNNSAIGRWTFIGGGIGNIASEYSATISGGRLNVASNYYATVAGGYGNGASGFVATVGGGTSNSVSGNYATAAGGWGNSASSDYATISGGRLNVASNYYATVAGGYGNSASGNLATVGGGYSDTSSNYYATVGGGTVNVASSDYTTIGGGGWNRASNNAATVSGGLFNSASGNYATVGGGFYDTTKALYGGVLSGYSNLAGDAVTDTAATVTGGRNNSALDPYAFVGGGYLNNASRSFATIGGGYYNSASSGFTTVGGGVLNVASGYYATVGGGGWNAASGDYTTIGGGYNNSASGYSATVSGGDTDTAASQCSFATNYSTNVLSSHTNSAAFTTSHTTAANQVRAAAFSTGVLCFTMDHPNNPMKEILNQYAVGADDPILMYNGTAYIAENGRVGVNLPDYFDKINRNPRIQLTGVGTYEVFIAEKIKGNSFVIGGKAGTEVYWTVTAERKDINAEIARIQTPVEQPKTGELINHSLDDDALISIYDELNAKKPGVFAFKTEEGRSVHEQSKKMKEEKK